MALKTVRLKNGDAVYEALVVTTMMNVEMLLQRNPVALIELVETARDRDHVLFSGTPQALRELELIESFDETGRAWMHDAVRSIVCSAAEGEDLDITLVNPIAFSD